MQLSAEIRILAGQQTGNSRIVVLDKSVHSHPAGGGQLRSDVYLRDTQQRELGVKQRGGKAGWR